MVGVRVLTADLGGNGVVSARMLFQHSYNEQNVIRQGFR